jgi:hypothetical protein
MTSSPESLSSSELSPSTSIATVATRSSRLRGATSALAAAATASSITRKQSAKSLTAASTAAADTTQPPLSPESDDSESDLDLHTRSLKFSNDMDKINATLYVNSFSKF